jgi:hypothetical protein
MTPTRPEAALAAALRSIGLMEEPLPGQSIEEFAASVLARLRDLGYSVVPTPSYETRVQQMANALHEDCRLEWQAIAVADPERQVTQHMADAHYGQAHDLVRRIWPELDTPLPETGITTSWRPYCLSSACSFVSPTAPLAVAAVSWSRAFCSKKWAIICLVLDKAKRLSGYRMFNHACHVAWLRAVS